MSSKIREALTKVSDILGTWCDHLPPNKQDEAKEALDLADEALSADFGGRIPTDEAIKEAEMILQLSIGGVSHNQSRNGEAEAVRNV